MKVAVLQQYLKSLVDPLTASGTPKKVVDDIQRTCRDLEPFHDREFSELADFLMRAHQYEATGHWNGNSGDGVSALAKRLLDLQGKPGLDSELKSVKKMAAPRLKELAKQLKVEVVGTTKPELLEAIFSRLHASRTPWAVRELTNLKARADAPGADFAQIESNLNNLLEGFDEDELVRVSAAFDVTLVGKKSRNQAIEGIRRKVLATLFSKKLIAY